MTWPRTTYSRSISASIRKAKLAPKAKANRRLTAIKLRTWLGLSRASGICPLCSKTLRRRNTTVSTAAAETDHRIFSIHSITILSSTQIKDANIDYRVSILESSSATRSSLTLMWYVLWYGASYPRMHYLFNNNTVICKYPQAIATNNKVIFSFVVATDDWRREDIEDDEADFSENMAEFDDIVRGLTSTTLLSRWSKLRVKIAKRRRIWALDQVIK